MTWGDQGAAQPYAAGPGAGMRPGPGAGAVHGNPTSRPRMRGWVLTGVIVIGFSLAGLMLAAYYGATLGVTTTLLAVLCAAIPLGVVIPAFLWLDRFEAEPTRYLVFAFLWGALVAAVLAAVFNTSAQLLVAAAADAQAAEATTAVFVAPLVEESVKGLLVLLIWWFRRREFDGIIDGIVYAGLVAAGFAFTENIQYLGMAYREGGESTLAALFVLRGVMTPFAHPLFTTMTGIGIGIAATTRLRWLRVAAPLAGWILAVLLHGVWNLGAMSGAQGLLGLFVVVEVPIFLAFVGFVVWARRREGRLIGRFLMPYADAGWVSRAEVGMLSSMSARRAARAWARHNGGRPALRSMRAFQDVASELALLRQRMHHTTADAHALETERVLLDALVSHRREFVGSALV